MRGRRVLLLFVFAVSPIFAAISGNAQWELRTTGGDTNGGCFVYGATGTDYSQQDAAQAAFTDLVIGATNTQLTSTANPFSSVSPGNCINITGGTGFTVGRYYIVSVTGSTATMDRAVGTANSTAGTGNLGGAVASLGSFFPSAITSGNVIWMRSGTYIFTSSPTFSSSSGLSFSLIGYGSTRGDNGTKPVLTTSTNSINIITFSSIAGGAHEYRNLAFTNTAATKGNAISVGSSGNPSLTVEDCTFSGFAIAVNIAGGSGGTSSVINSSFTANTRAVYFFAGGFYVLKNDYIYANGSGTGINNAQVSYPSAVFGRVTISDCVIAAGTASGVYMSGTAGWQLTVTNSTIANNAETGITLTNDGITAYAPVLWATNNIFYGNAGTAITSGSVLRPGFVYANTNAFGGNGTNYSNLGSSTINDIALSANPFTSSATGNFSLNSTVGGGALLKGATQATPFTSNYRDLGPQQSQCSGGSSVSSTVFACGIRQ